MLEILISKAPIVATFVGLGSLLLAAFALYQSYKLNQTKFEDSLNKEYRDLVSCIPVEILMGMPFRDIPDERKCEVKECEVRERIYNYLDLCNEQVYLRKVGRVSKKCWENWRAGIEDNLSPSRPRRPPRPEFVKVWKEVRKKDRGTFSYLERLEKDGFASDAYYWDWC